MLIRSCHEDVILTRKSHNCAGTASVQGDSAGGSKLIEQTIPFVNLSVKLHPDSFDAYRVETLCLQHTLARLSMIFRKP